MSRSSHGSSSRSCLAIILAAGEGTRMKSSTPKPLHKVAGKALLTYVLEAVSESGASHTAVVIGPNGDLVAKEANRTSSKAAIYVQTDRLGTAHAVLAARDSLVEHKVDDVVVAFADTPLIGAETLARLRAPLADGAAVTVLGFEARDPTGYGRLIVEHGTLKGIREHRDASSEERKLTFCNAGLMALRGDVALTILERIGNANAKKEFYLTDAVAIAVSMGEKTVAVEAPEQEVLGINDRVQLAEAEAVMQDILRRKAMENGATLIDPKSVFLCTDTCIGRDVVIEPGVVFGPHVVVEDEVVIHAFSHLEGVHLKKGSQAGPFVRLRPGSVIGAGARVGNFVEVKNSTLHEGVKAGHLTYLGDADVGAQTNIGAGTITCNYDGWSKFRTVIGENAFIGSNTSLVAPVTVGQGAYVGSGSTITADVPADALAIGRGRQVVMEGRAERIRAERGKKGSH